MTSDLHFEAEGLRESVTIAVDRWGVPHIDGSNASDAFFAQGFNAARDRLWQLDYQRRRSLGLLSEVFGSRLVPHDIAARRFVYRGDMRAEWLAYANDTKEIVHSFVAGINQYIELVLAETLPLPLEFKTLGYAPQRWEPEDVVRMRAHGLMFNAREEVRRHKVLTASGSEAEDLRRLLDPAHSPITEPVDVPEAVLDAAIRQYDFGTMPVQFHGSDLESIGIEQVRNGADGSNNWVLAPSKTATGRAIVASDPHRVTNALPSLRYIAHLRCPEFDVIGGGEPLLPGISIGHNGKIAFGLTIYPIDQEDLFILRLDPEDPGQYWYRDNWVRFERVQEEVAVRNAESVTAEVLYSVHGPVLHVDAQENLAVALKAAWLEPGAAPYLGAIEYMRAGSVDAFVQAMNRWATPPENQVVADQNGAIAWKPGGLVPLRTTHDGLLPVEGDGSHEWHGFADADQLPVRRDPAEGFIVTANQKLLDDDHDPSFHVSYEWHPDYRSTRIAALLAESDEHTVDSSFAMQTDSHSEVAAYVIPLIRDRLQPQGSELFGFLDQWDYRLAADSGQALAWETWWWKHFVPALYRSRASELGHSDPDATLALVRDPLDPMQDHRPAVAELERLLDAQPEAARNLVSSTASAAWNSLQETHGEPSQWRWGAVHQAYAAHPLASILEAAGVPSELVRTPLRPRSGGHETVGLGSYSADGLQVVGSTFRVVIDVGEWDQSVALNSPGQSGCLESGNSQALFQSWIDNESFPLLYSRELVSQNTAFTITLTPAQKGA